jgi:uncharacterized membrane protein YgdD (TMEM256/DUF423 family)
MNRDQAPSARLLLVLGAASGFAAVALGAFGAHGLQDIVDAGRQQAFATAVQYHGWHALAVIVAGLAARQSDTRALAVAGWLFIAGMLLFSGSIYALVLGAPRWLGPVTPVGGTLLMAGWATLAIGFWKTGPQ